MRLLYITPMLWLFASLPAAAAPIDDVAVTPLPGPASCYAGTAGTDHVFFLRANLNTIDCAIFSGGPTCLNRREFPGDGPNGRAVSLESPIVQRPSVNGAGTIVGFSEFGFNMCFMNSDSEDTEGCFSRDLFGWDPHSVSIHPNGLFVAATQVDAFTFEPTRFIRVLDGNLIQQGGVYQISQPGPGGANLQIETVDFTVDNEYLIIDAYNPVTGLWGIFAVNVTTAVTTPLVAPVAGLHIRNPQLAQTSDDHLVFDAFDLQSGVNTVLAANLLTGDLSTVATTGTLSYPSYTGDDGAVVFTEVDGATATGFSLDIQGLAADRITAVGARTRWLTDGGVPEIYRRGTWNGTLLPPAVCAPVVDTDGDGIADDQDNCSATANPGQVDADGDSLGNICDADFNNDCIVNALDLGILKSVFFTADAEADMNADGLVNAVDLGIFKTRFFLPPGPSGLPDLCD